MTLTATPGSTADSYVDVATADTYFSSRLYADTWEEATPQSKEKALKMATKILDAMDWKGTKTDSGNSLRWPRTGVYNRDDEALDSETIPAFLEEATAELALDLLDDDTTKTSEQDKALVKKVKAGPVDVEFAVPDVSEKKALQSDVVWLISYYLDSSGARILRA